MSIALCRAPAKGRLGLVLVAMFGPALASPVFVGPAFVGQARAEFLTPPQGANNVAAYGAPLDGVRDDGPAFSTARLRSRPGAKIIVPPGTFHPLSGVTSAPPGAMFWDMQGVGYDSANTTPVVSLNHDLVANVLPGGTRFYGRGPDTSPDIGPIFRIDRGYEFDGGRVGNVTPALGVNCNLRGKIENYVWCNQTVVTSRASGSGNHLAVSGSIFRPADALADGKGPRAETWGGYFENNDQTGQPSDIAGAQVGIENDVYNNGPDPKGYRIILQMNVGKANPNGPPGAARRGVTIGSSDGASTLGSGYDLTAPFTVAAFDASAGKAVGGAPAFRMAEGQRFCFDAQNQRCLAYAGGRIAFTEGPSSALELVDHGGARLANYATDPQKAVSVPGAIYFNTTSRALRVFNGEVWAFVAPQPTTPDSSHAPCARGERAFDSRFSYLCVATNEWRRERLEAF